MLFEQRPLLCMLISDMDKIINFEGRSIFHIVQILVVAHGSVGIVVCLCGTIKILLSHLLNIFLFFICLPFNPVGIPTVYVLDLELRVLSCPILFPLFFLLVCTRHTEGKENFWPDS